MQDPRTEMKNCDICANDVFRESWKETGVAPAAFAPPSFKSSRVGQRQCRGGQGHGGPGGPDPGHYRPRAGGVEQAEVIPSVRIDVSGFPGENGSFPGTGSGGHYRNSAAELCMPSSEHPSEHPSPTGRGDIVGWAERAPCTHGRRVPPIGKICEIGPG